MTANSDNGQNDLLNLGKNFSSSLREMRKERSLTQHDLSDRSGLSLRMISDLERNVRQPTLMTLFKLAKGLNISMRDFMERLLGDMDL